MHFYCEIKNHGQWHMADPFNINGGDADEEEEVQIPDLNKFANDDRKLPPGVKQDASDNEDDAGGDDQDVQDSSDDSDDTGGGEDESDVDSDVGYQTQQQQPQRNWLEPPAPQRMNQMQRMQLRAKLRAQIERMDRIHSLRIVIPPNISLRDLQDMHATITYQVKSEQSVRGYRKTFIFLVSLWEGMLKRYPRLGLDADGLCKHIYEQLDIFDEDFYDLYDLYGGMSFHPLVNISWTLVITTVTYSLQKKMIADPYAMGQNNEPAKPPSVVPPLSTPVQQSTTQTYTPMDAPNVNPHRRMAATTRPSKPVVNNDDDDDSEYGDMNGLEALRREEDRLQQRRQPAESVVTSAAAPSRANQLLL